MERLFPRRGSSALRVVLFASLVSMSGATACAFWDMGNWSDHYAGVGPEAAVDGSIDAAGNADATRDATRDGGKPDAGRDTGAPDAADAGHKDAGAILLYVAGNTSSAGFPVTNGTTYVADAGNGFLSVVTPEKSSTLLDFSTYLGKGPTVLPTLQQALWIDPTTGDVFVGGTSTDPSYATAGTFQSTIAGTSSGILCRLTATGTKKWCSYLGGTGAFEQQVLAIAGLDKDGNLAVCGVSDAVDDGVTFDGVSARRFGPASMGVQAYVAKITPDGSAIVWFSGFGGSASEAAELCVLDSTGDVVGTGFTNSIDFPASASAFQTVNRGDATTHESGMVFKVSSDGSQLVWASYLGGGTSVGGLGDASQGGIALDVKKDLYVVANTPSANFFPTGVTGLQKTLQAGDGVFACAIAKIKGDGSEILDSTFLGGTTGGAPWAGEEPPVGTACGGLVLSPTGRVVVSGFTTYTDFPTTKGAYQAVLRGTSAGFVTSLSPDLSTLVASTYIGGSNGIVYQDKGCLAVAGDGRPFGALTTTATDFPVSSNALDSERLTVGADVVLFGLDPDLRALSYGTYMGALGGDSIPLALALTAGP